MHPRDSGHTRSYIMLIYHDQTLRVGCSVLIADVLTKRCFCGDGVSDLCVQVSAHVQNGIGFRCKFKFEVLAVSRYVPRCCRRCRLCVWVGTAGCRYVGGDLCVA